MSQRSHYMQELATGRDVQGHDAAPHRHQGPDASKDQPCQHREYYTINETTGMHRCLDTCGYQFHDTSRPPQPWAESDPLDIVDPSGRL